MGKVGELARREKTYDACVDPGGPDLSGSLFVGVDASVRRDSTACVCVKYDENSHGLVLADYKIWKPTPGQPMTSRQVSSST